LGGGVGAGVGFFVIVGGGGGGCSGGRGRVGLLLDVDIPKGRAPPNPPFSGSGTSPGVSGLSSTEVSNTSCNGCGPANQNILVNLLRLKCKIMHFT